MEEERSSDYWRQWQWSFIYHSGNQRRRQRSDVQLRGKQRWRHCRYPRGSVDGDDADPNAHSDANSNCDANSNANGDSNCDANSNSDGDANANGDTNANSDANSDGDANSNSNADGNSISNAGHSGHNHLSNTECNSGGWNWCV